MLFESNILDLLKILPYRRKQREKSRMRELLSQKRRMLTVEMVRESSDQVVALIEQLPAFQAAQTVLIYYPTRNEIDVLSLIKKYKRQLTYGSDAGELVVRITVGSLNAEKSLDLLKEILLDMVSIVQ